MQHVDEGLLQAWLDRPRSGISEEDRVALEEHLAQCPRCAARVQALRDASDRAVDLLAHVMETDEKEIPAFDAVLSRGRQLDAGHRSLRRWRVPAGWAASIVLALGVGWLANEIGREPAEQPPAASLGRASGTATAVAEAAADSEAMPMVDQEAAVVADAREAAPAAAAHPDARAADTPTREIVAEAPALASRLHDLVVTGAAADSTQSPRAVTISPLKAGDLRAGRGVQVSPVRTVSPSGTGALQASRAGVEEVPMWRAVSRVEAQAFVGFPVRMVPGLDVVSLEVGILEGVPVVRVVQLLEGAQKLTLLEAARELTFPEQQTGGSATVQPDSSVFVEGRAPLSADSIKVLLKRIR